LLASRLSAFRSLVLPICFFRSLQTFRAERCGDLGERPPRPAISVRASSCRRTTSGAVRYLRIVSPQAVGATVSVPACISTPPYATRITSRRETQMTLNLPGDCCSRAPLTQSRARRMLATSNWAAACCCAWIPNETRGTDTRKSVNRSIGLRGTSGLSQLEESTCFMHLNRNASSPRPDFH
jgi:hypothetical protein